MLRRVLLLITLLSYGTVIPKETSIPNDYVNVNATKGGSIHLPHLKYPNIFHPHPSRGSPYPGLYLVYETLIEKNNENSYTTLLAKRLIEKDGYIIIELDNMASFQSRSINTNDVLYSIQSFTKNAHPQLQSLFSQLKVEAISNQLFSIHYRIPKEDLYLLLASIPIMPKGHDIESPPIGSGPYRYIQHNSSLIEYERNPSYWALNHKKGYYNFNQITYRFYPSTNAISRAFQNHEIDYYLEYSAQNWNQVHDDPDLVYATLPHPTQSYMQMLWYNHRNAPFDNKQVRKAISLLIDPGFINQWFFESHYTTPKSNNDLRERLLKASKYLDLGGFEIKDGYRYKNGKKLSIKLITHQRNLDPVFQLLKHHCKRIGVELEIYHLSKPEFLFQKAKGDYHLILNPIVIDKDRKSLSDMAFIQKFASFPKHTILCNTYSKLPRYLAYPVMITVLKDLGEESLVSSLWSIDCFRIGYHRKLNFIHTDQPYIDINTWWSLE